MFEWDNIRATRPQRIRRLRRIIKFTHLLFIITNEHEICSFPYRNLLPLRIGLVVDVMQLFIIYYLSLLTNSI